MKPRKVFCIGFQKTGTTTLGMALDKLGYHVTGYLPFREMAQDADLTWDQVKERALTLAQSHDAAKDTPWPLLYKELDAAFPGSQFIHVVRDSDAWLNSAVNDFAAFPNEIHRLIYGSPSPVGNEAVWQAKYDQHNREVAAYFADRTDDYLSLSLSRDPANWQKLCDFLGETPPSGEWPHANTRAAKKVKMKARRLMSRLGLR